MDSTGGFLQFVGIVVVIVGVIAGFVMWPDSGYNYEISVSEAEIKDLEAIQRMIKTGIKTDASMARAVRNAHKQGIAVAVSTSVSCSILGLFLFGFGHLLHLVRSIGDKINSGQAVAIGATEAPSENAS